MSRRLIGLTGGIGTGKTTVSRYLETAYHLPILDADLYAREAVQSNSPILAAIFNRYGQQVQLPNNQLNRQKLGEIIFNDSTEKQWLEGQIHPYVRQKLELEINKLDLPIIILAIPLLFEANMVDLVNEIWVVYCPYKEQIKRLIKRDNLTNEQGINRIKNQLSIEEKIKLADVILDNSSDLETLQKQIDMALNNQNKKQLSIPILHHLG